MSFLTAFPLLYPVQVSLPIPKPQAFRPGDNYKIQFSFAGLWICGLWLGIGLEGAVPRLERIMICTKTATPVWLHLLSSSPPSNLTTAPPPPTPIAAGDQFVTPWLLVMGRYLSLVSYLDVELTHTGGELRSVRAAVYDLPHRDAAAHPLLVSQWANASHWPKPLLVQYRWVAGAEVRGDRALLLLFAAAAALLGLVLSNAYRSYRRHLAAFVVAVAAPTQPKAD